MSFYYNNNTVKTVFFNGREVSSIYYKGVLAWEKPTFTWPGWNNATWEDVYNLCRAKQNGIITSWPSDISTNCVKTVNLSTSILGTTSVPMRIIGIDADGDGVLTFMADNALAEKTKFSTTKYWISSIARDYCVEFYNACDAMAYIKPLSKGTVHDFTSGQLSITDPTYNMEYVWLPSIIELNGEPDGYLNPYEFTEGVSTPYTYFNNTTRKRCLEGKTAGVSYWTRSRHHMGGATVSAVAENGKLYEGLRGNIDTYGFVPCFAIG